MLNRSELFIDQSDMYTVSSPDSNSLIMNVNNIEIRDDNSVIIKNIDIDNFFLSKLNKIEINGYSFFKRREENN